MDREEITSVGLDIGTTTTQMVVSRLVLEKTAGMGEGAEVKVTRREVIYRSPVCFTALTADDRIDAAAAASFLKEQYARAGIFPDQVGTGAVIITGESAHKRNARQVIDALSGLAGDFVAAAAGPDLESSLAGRGAGAAEASLRLDEPVLNVDIGGGTSNLCLFADGEEADTACADIGGRMVCVDGELRVTRLSPKMKMLVRDAGLPIRVGGTVTPEILRRAASLLAEALAQVCGLVPMTDLGRRLITNHPLHKERRPGRISFSGGVAACMEHPGEPLFRYGDLGPLLAEAILRHPAFAGVKKVPAAETIRATVIGAGTCSMKVSGSTISCEGVKFPLKNRQIVPLHYEKEEDLAGLPEQIRQGLSVLAQSGEMRGALWFAGSRSPSFGEVEALAGILAPYLTEAARQGEILPVIVGADFGKALGQALRRKTKRKIPVLCLDGISCRQGDYIDIGAPVGGGIALPVVVKTLLFPEEYGYGYTDDHGKGQ